MRSIGFVLQASLFLSTVNAGVAPAQQVTAPASPAPLPATAPVSGPVPPAILSARKIFVSNAGADSGLFPKPFSGDTNRAYNRFFASLRHLGQFDLITDPSGADLVLELQLLAPTGPKDPDKQKGASEPVPEFRLTIFDRRSHYILWTLTESIGVAHFQKTHDRNFDEALSRLVIDFQQLTGKSPATYLAP